MRGVGDGSNGDGVGDGQNGERKRWSLTNFPEEVVKAMPSTARKEIRAILVYMTFIVFYIASTSEAFATHNVFFFANALKSQFMGVEMREEFSPTFDKAFDDIATVEELYHWLQSGFQHSAFAPNTFDSSDRKAGMKPGYTLGPNKIIGAIRVSQVRSKRGPCSKFPTVLGQHGHVFECLEGGEPMEPHGNFTWDDTPGFQFERDGIKIFNGTHPEYTKLPEGTVSKERDMPYSSYFSKRLEVRYKASGWAVLMDPQAPLEVNEEAILALVNGKYIDLQTTAVFVDLTVYNPNLDYMCVIKLVAELPPGGGVITSSEFHVVRVFNRYTTQDKITFVLEAVVGCFYCYYFLEQLYRLRAHGWGYLFEGMSNWLIMANVWMYCAGIFYNRKMLFLSPENLNVDSGDFANYWPAGCCARWVIQLASTNCFLNFFQGIEHLSYVPTFALLSDTIHVAGPQLMSFAFVFSLVGYGFIQAHTMVFRDKLEGYRSIKHAGFSLMCSLLGDFDFNALYEADNTLGPFFFVFFIGLAVFVVLNMVIAIISDAYSVCSQQMREKPTVHLRKEVYSFIFEHLEQLPWGIGRRIYKQRVHFETKVAEGKGRVLAIANKGLRKNHREILTSKAMSSVVVPEETLLPKALRPASVLMPPILGSEHENEANVPSSWKALAKQLLLEQQQLRAEQVRARAEQQRTNELLELLLAQGKEG
jgi:hypothetical protein